MDTLSKALITLLLLSFSLIIHAEEIRYYDVEVVLFENLDNASRQGENWARLYKKDALDLSSCMAMV